jgi:hypothetical protein
MTQTPDTKPKLYILQKKVLALSVEEAIQKAANLPIDSVFPDANQPEQAKADLIGFKTIPIPE